MTQISLKISATKDLKSGNYDQICDITKNLCKINRKPSNFVQGTRDWSDWKNGQFRAKVSVQKSNLYIETKSLSPRRFQFFSQFQRVYGVKDLLVTEDQLPFYLKFPKKYIAAFSLTASFPDSKKQVMLFEGKVEGEMI